ncbi:MAG: TIR domain-containing protein [Actinomycetota bacterium]|nr:TIR domain-containing protein [Actinomycetota bacterium]
MHTLKRQGLIDEWYDRRITPGQEWEDTIDENLETADIVLLLVSQDFLDSDYAYYREMSRALERNTQGEVTIIPIIVRPADWEGEPFAKFQVLPDGAKPVTEWANRDKAWLNVARGIRKTIEELRNEPVEQKIEDAAGETRLEMGDTREPHADQQNRAARQEDQPDKRMTKAASRKANELSVDVTEVEGTGSSGIITVRDVMNAAASGHITFGDVVSAAQHRSVNSILGRLMGDAHSAGTGHQRVRQQTMSGTPTGMLRRYQKVVYWPNRWWSFEGDLEAYAHRFRFMYTDARGRPQQFEIPFELVTAVTADEKSLIIHTDAHEYEFEQATFQTDPKTLVSTLRDLVDST